MTKRMALLFIVLFSAPAAAQSENTQFDLTLSPPPLGNPSYGGAVFDQRSAGGGKGVGHTEIGGALSRGSTQNVSVFALGAQGAYRWVHGAYGVRVPAAIGAAFGDAFDSGFSGYGFSLGALVDVNLIAFDWGSIQLFGGYGLEGSVAQFTRTAIRGDTDITAFTLAHGPRLG
ncbi:MAG: hypothetical protein AAFQ82_19775, partial [Myxococcota bacterium]